MTDSCAKREQNPHYGLYNGLRNLRARTGGRVPTFASNAKISSSHSEPKQEAGFRGRFEGRSITSGLPRYADHFRAGRTSRKGHLQTHALQQTTPCRGGGAADVTLGRLEQLRPAPVELGFAR